jgi:hypothetical protein
MNISNFITDFIDKFIIEVKKEENINKLEKNLIDPLIHYTFKKLYPYLMITSIIFLLTFLLAILILLLQVNQIRKVIHK